MPACLRDCFEWMLFLVMNDDYEDCYLEDEFKEDTPENVGASSKENLTSSKNNGAADEEIKPLSTRRTQIFNRHGYNLAIFPGGVVKGVREAFHPNAVLNIITLALGEVQIRGFELGNYVAMDQDGKIYGEKDSSEEKTIFMEHFMGNHIMYLSKKYAHFGWYLGIKKSGVPKNGRLTWHPWPQKAIFFTYRPPYDKPLDCFVMKNRHGYFLRIEDGLVKGTKDKNDEFAVLELIPGSDIGTFRIRGIRDDTYVAMNSGGKLYGEVEPSNESALFIQQAQGKYFEYLSSKYAHFGWHIAVKKNGKAKRGKRTILPPHQKALQFQHLDPSDA